MSSCGPRKKTQLKGIEIEMGLGGGIGRVSYGLHSAMSVCVCCGGRSACQSGHLSDLAKVLDYSNPHHLIPG